MVQLAEQRPAEPPTQPVRMRRVAGQVDVVGVPIACNKTLAGADVEIVGRLASLERLRCGGPMFAIVQVVRDQVQGWLR